MTNVGLLPQKSDIWWVFLLQGFAGIILALQLPICFEVRALSGSLVSSTPE
jgi:hypothetical protein